MGQSRRRPTDLQSLPRAHALDVSSVAEIPSIFATWNNLPVRNIAYRERKDPIVPIQSTVSASRLASTSSLPQISAGKRIAFSPGQAQGTLVLRAFHAAGLTKKDATLVELPSTADIYPKALASKQVDMRRSAASISAATSASIGSDGASLIEHGLRDDPSHLCAPQWVLDDPAKTAALAEYVAFGRAATEWVDQRS